MEEFKDALCTLLMRGPSKIQSAAKENCRHPLSQRPNLGNVRSTTTGGSISGAMRATNGAARRADADAMPSSMQTLAMCMRVNSGIGGVRTTGFLLNHQLDR